ncbi:hypothetical protein L0F63_007418 [Massospora cicadina]|nr:hypothetical protein L0F63_007418 [Massospora cicadina]
MEPRSTGGFQKKRFKFTAPIPTKSLRPQNLSGSGGFATPGPKPFSGNPLGEEEKVGRPDPASFLAPELGFSGAGHASHKLVGSSQVLEGGRTENSNITHSEGDSRRAKEETSVVSDEEGDPLDSYMAGIVNQARQEAAAPSRTPRPVNMEDEQEDYLTSFIKHRKNKPVLTIQSGGDSDEDVYATARAIDLQDEGEEYDSEDPQLGQGVKGEVAPLPPIDHSSMEYCEISKDHYKEHEDIANLPLEKVKAIRDEADIRVSGRDPPNPCLAFAHFQFDARLLARVANSQYERPTPIQQQAVPVALQGRDVVGIAQTGSGKTAAYLWPLLVHVIHQPPLEVRDGPLGLVLAPTRELAHQIGSEARKFAKAYGGRVRVGVVSGGFSKLDQFKELRAGVEVLIATPGRLIDLIKMKATNLTRVSYLVVDEADRLLDLGFEPQVNSIAGNIRPDRQTLLFSATFPAPIESLACRLLTDPVRIAVGGVGQANLDVTQTYDVISDSAMKWGSLLMYLPVIFKAPDARILIFVSTKLASEQLSASLVQEGYACLALHGDLSQVERDQVLSRFKAGGCRLVVATDVAARGLDVPGVSWVINYDVARDVDAHVHRVGRTGRAGRRGQAVTFLAKDEPRDCKFAADLVMNLEGASQEVPPHLLDAAMLNPKFKRMRQGRRGGKGRVGGRPGGRPGGRGRGGGGIGFTGANASTRGGFIKFQPASSNPPSST